MESLAHPLTGSTSRSGAAAGGQVRKGALACLLLAILTASAAAPADGFVWRTDSIRASVRRDPVTPLLGQFLLLEQSLEPGETGWVKLKIDLPESWKVGEVQVAAGKVALTLADGTRFELTAENVSTLQFEILDGGPKSDAAIDELWREHALVGK